MDYYSKYIKYKKKYLDLVAGSGVNGSVWGRNTKDDGSGVNGSVWGRNTKVAGSSVDGSGWVHTRAHDTPVRELKTSQGQPAPELKTSQGQPVPELKTSQGQPAPELKTSQDQPAPELKTSQGQPAPELKTSQGQPVPELKTSQGQPAPAQKSAQDIPAPELKTSQGQPAPEQTSKLFEESVGPPIEEISETYKHEEAIIIFYIKPTFMYLLNGTEKIENSDEIVPVNQKHIIPIKVDRFIPDNYTNINIRLSSCNNHIPNYRTRHDINSEQIPFNFFYEFSNNIPKSNNIICCYNYHPKTRKSDLQLGITESRKGTEKIYITASRGIYEEIGLYIPPEYIVKNSTLFILSTTHPVNLIIIDGSDFFNQPIDDDTDYEYKTNFGIDNINKFMSTYIESYNFKNKIKKVLILLHGNDKVNIINKIKNIDRSKVKYSLSDSKNEKELKEYLRISPYIINASDILHFFDRNRYNNTPI